MADISNLIVQNRVHVCNIFYFYRAKISMECIERKIEVGKK